MLLLFSENILSDTYHISYLYNLDICVIIDEQKEKKKNGKKRKKAFPTEIKERKTNTSESLIVTTKMIFVIYF